MVDRKSRAHDNGEGSSVFNILIIVQHLSMFLVINKFPNLFCKLAVYKTIIVPNYERLLDDLKSENLQFELVDLILSFPSLLFRALAMLLLLPSRGAGEWVLLELSLWQTCVTSGVTITL